MVNSELRILGVDQGGCAYTDINIVTRGGAKTGADLGATEQGPIRRAPLKAPAFDPVQQKAYLWDAVEVMQEVIHAREVGPAEGELLPAIGCPPSRCLSLLTPSVEDEVQGWLQTFLWILGDDRAATSLTEILARVVGVPAATVENPLNRVQKKRSGKE